MLSVLLAALCIRCEKQGKQQARSEQSATPGIADRAKDRQPDQSLVERLAKIGIKAETKSQDEILIKEGFPYEKNIKGRDTIEIAKVEKGIFTASDKSSVPIEMMGMVYGVAGGSFIAKCNAKDGRRTLADRIGNTWIFLDQGMEFNVFLPGSTNRAYSVRSIVSGASISFAEDGVLLKGFTIDLAPGPQESETQEAGTPSLLVSDAYNDPKGFFRIVPPKGWRLQEYPQDPRGKVAFIAPEDQIDLRVLSKAVDIADYDGLLKNLKDIEAQLGVPMNIAPIVFKGMPAFKRVTTLNVQGGMLRLLWIDLLIDGLSHNLQYGAPPNKFDEHYDIAWQSMLTFEPLRRTKQTSPEEVRRHEVAKWIRLARIALEMGNTQVAKVAISAGLKADPEDPELKQLESELEKR
jgi:hypothetical protein